MWPLVTRARTIPVAAVGGAAAELWRQVDVDFGALWPVGAPPIRAARRPERIA